MRKTIASAALLIAGMFLAGSAHFTANAAELPAPSQETTQHGMTYAKYEFERDGVQKLFTASMNPADKNCAYEFVIHHIEAEGGGFKRSYVADIAADYEAKSGRKVFAATNGDFFQGSGAKVTPIDSYVKDGVVLQTGAYSWKHCFGFDNKGNTALGRLEQTENRLTVISADGKTQREFEFVLNKAPVNDGDISVYNRSGSYTVKGAGKYILTATSSDVTTLPVYGESRRTAEGTVVNDDAFTLKAGQFAIVVKGDNETARFFYDTLWYGAKANLVRIPAGAFAGMEYVVGGWDMLVKEGVLNTSCRTDTQNAGGVPAPRTFFGMKEDGTMMLCALDGRQSGYSVGLTVQQEAQLAYELGLYNAIELDGGGSTIFLLRENDELVVKNIPSDVSEGRHVPRAVCNAVLIVEKETASEPPIEPPIENPPVENPPKEDPPEAEQPKKSGGLEIGLIVGGGVVAVAILVAVVVVVKKKKGDKNHEE